MLYNSIHLKKAQKNFYSGFLFWIINLILRFNFKNLDNLNLIFLFVALGFGFINPEDILFGFDLQFLDLCNPENICTKQFVVDFSIGSFRSTLTTKGILELVSQSRIGFGIGKIKNQPITT